MVQLIINANTQARSYQGTVSLACILDCLEDIPSVRPSVCQESLNMVYHDHYQFLSLLTLQTVTETGQLRPAIQTHTAQPPQTAHSSSDPEASDQPSSDCKVSDQTFQRRSESINGQLQNKQSSAEWKAPYLTAKRKLNIPASGWTSSRGHPSSDLTRQL